MHLSTICRIDQTIFRRSDLPNILPRVPLISVFVLDLRLGPIVFDL